MEVQAVLCSYTDSTEKKDFAEAHPIEQSKHMITIMRRTFMMGGGCLCQGNRLRFCFIVVFRRYSGHKMTVGLVAKNNNQHRQFVHSFIACRRVAKSDWYLVTPLDY
jgi:hypothetical protein